MSEFSANTLMPLFSALSEEEQRSFAEKISKVLGTRKKSTPKKKSVYDNMYPKWRQENKEMLISEIMHGS